MKKQFLLLAGSALILASCGSNNNQPAQSQAQIDSALNAKMAAHDAENAAKNDSTLKAIEKEKAEAVMKEKEAEHAGAKKHSGEKKDANQNPTPAPPPPPPPPQTGGMRGHAQQDNNPPSNSTNNAGGGMRGHAQQTQQGK